MVNKLEMHAVEDGAAACRKAFVDSVLRCKPSCKAKSDVLYLFSSLRIGVTVARLTLAQFVRVQILNPQPLLPVRQKPE